MRGTDLEEIFKVIRSWDEGSDIFELGFYRELETLWTDDEGINEEFGRRTYHGER